jgi:hypothetical protein
MPYVDRALKARANKRYRATARGRAARRAANKRYARSDKGVDAAYRYNHSVEGLVSQMRAYTNRLLRQEAK